MTVSLLVSGHLSVLIQKRESATCIIFFHASCSLEGGLLITMLYKNCYKAQLLRYSQGVHSG